MAIDVAAAETVRERIEDNIRMTRRLLEGEQLERVAFVAGVITDAYLNGRKVILFGNGGSAADAQHVAGEFLGRYYLERRSLPAIALADPVPLSAIGNDYAFADVFARQIEGLGEPGDVAIGISTSGASANVIRGLEAANTKGMVTVALTGARGRRLAEVADYCIVVPSEETPRIQEGHILVCHVLCELVERELFA
jgi:D-sedoheptulose 7-phosphate isomerase